MVVHACIDFNSARGFPITSKVNGALGEVTTTDSLTFLRRWEELGGGISRTLLVIRGEGLVSEIRRYCKQFTLAVNLFYLAKGSSRIQVEWYYAIFCDISLLPFPNFYCRRAVSKRSVPAIDCLLPLLLDWYSISSVFGNSTWQIPSGGTARHIILTRLSS